MRRLPIVLVVVALVGAACGGDGSNDTSAESTTTTSTSTTTVPDDDGPATFCDGFATVSFSLDEITRTMVATMNGEEPGEFILVLDDSVAVMAATAQLAPADLADQASLVASTYAGFEDLLLETDFDVAGLPVDDPRAAALTDPALSAAIGAMNDHCGDQPDGDA